MNTAEQHVRVMVGDTMLTLHPHDFNDVGLTAAGAKLVRKAALAVFGGRMLEDKDSSFALTLELCKKAKNPFFFVGFLIQSA